MKITKEQIKETLKLVMNEEADYKVFFKKALEKAGKSIPSMSDDEKKEFFNKIDSAWDAKGEVKEGNAFGAAVTKAKEDGDDEFEVDGKTFKVEESHSDCGCGCGGVTEGGCGVPKNKSVNEGKFKVDDLVYNKRTKTVGIVRIGDDKSGEAKTDADGNVDVDELEKYNPIKNKHQNNAKVAPSTEKEVSKRGLFNPFKNESVVNERYSDFIKAKNLTDIIKLSKQKKNATFYVTDDNNSRIGTFYLKNGKFAKATTANANYDLQNSKTSLKNRNDVIYKYKVDESVNEAASKEAMGIAALTGTRGSAVEEFINKHELDGGKLFRSIKKANLRGRLNFVSALAGKDGNPNQKLTIKLHKKKFNEVLSTDLAFEVITFMERPVMETIMVKELEVGDVVEMLVNEGINDVLTEGVKAEFNTLVETYNKK